MRRACIHEPGYVGGMYRAHINAFDDVKVYRLEDGLANAVRSATGLKVTIGTENASEKHPEIKDSVLAAIYESERSICEEYGYSVDF